MTTEHNWYMALVVSSFYFLITLIVTSDLRIRHKVRFILLGLVIGAILLAIPARAAECDVAHPCISLSPSSISPPQSPINRCVGTANAIQLGGEIGSLVAAATAPVAWRGPERWQPTLLAISATTALLTAIAFGTAQLLRTPLASFCY